MTLPEAMNLVAVALMTGGTFFFVVGTLGLLRFPDFFSRVHAVGKCDTLGALLLLSGLSAHYLGTHHTLEEILSVVELGFVVAFLFLANPMSTHAFARAALRAGLKPSGADFDPQAPSESHVWRATGSRPPSGGEA